MEWISAYLHRASGHLKLQGRINKVSSFKNTGRMSKATCISAPQGAAPERRKQWDPQQNMNSKQLLQSLTHAPALTVQPFVPHQICVQWMYPYKKKQPHLYAFFFYLHNLYSFYLSAYTRPHSFAFVCLFLKSVVMIRTCRHYEKKISLSVFSPRVSLLLLQPLQSVPLLP